VEIVEKIVAWLANLIQIGTAAFTLFVIWQARRHLKRYAERMQRREGAVPMALAIGIGGSIEGAVRGYLDGKGLAQVQIRELTYPGRLPSSKFHQLLSGVQKIKQDLTDLGVTEVHLFYKGPVTLAMGIGSILDNWVPIKVYELDKETGSYIYNFTLGKGAVLEILREAAEVGEDIVVAALTRDAEAE
jgi:hypothetical protein